MDSLNPASVLLSQQQVLQLDKCKFDTVLTSKSRNSLTLKLSNQQENHPLSKVKISYKVPPSILCFVVQLSCTDEKIRKAFFDYINVQNFSSGKSLVINDPLEALRIVRLLKDSCSHSSSNRSIPQMDFNNAINDLNQYL